MGVDDAPRDIQSQPCTLAYVLGREKRVKDAVANVLGNARAIVDNLYHYSPIVTANLDAQLAALRQSVEGIIDKICPDLVEFTGVSGNGRNVVPIFPRYPDIFLL
jgi:hypothetical protein